MECNRDEAIRAKTIAEKKLVDKDFAGAKKFSLKAQTLYPELDGISQMLVTLDVYISSENKVNGESDWYGILDVKPSDDDEMIRKQYRKLVLMLHPDKNKSVGADGAFKILSEAWGVLSDKSKRSAYNQRRNVRGFQQKVSFQSHRSSSSSSSPSVNVVHRSATKPTSKPKTAPAPARARVPVRPKPQPPPPAPVRRSDSFWTFCHQCKMHYEYFKVHLNCTILCPSCQKPFRAVEVPIPKNFPKPTSRRGVSKIHLDPGSRAKVQFTDGPSGASMGDDKCKRECEDFNAQRLSKRRKNDEDSSDVKVRN